MITPIELSRVKFSRSFTGYSEKEVEDFIIRISQDYEKLFSENQALKKKISQLETKMQSFVEMEGNLKKTLVSAQKTSSEIREDAQRKAELILKEAELNAERVVEEAREEVRDLTRRIRLMKKQKKQVRLELLEVVKKYTQLLELEENREKEDGD